MNQDATLYNVRLVTIYLKLVRERYPHVSISEILSHAGLEPYEIEDEGHWLTQSQIDRFYEKIVQLTGNDNIAREAGRMAASPGTIGIMRQYTLGLMSPFQAFSAIHKTTKNFTRSSEYVSHPLTKNKVEITVRPNPGVEEKPFQCENRMGFFEAIVDGFNLGLPRIEHPECLFRGGSVCRYTVSWRRTFTHLAGRVRNAVAGLAVLTLAPGLIVAPTATLHYLLPPALIAVFFAALATEIARRRELDRGISRVQDTAERLAQQIDMNYRNVQLTQEIGQALANKKSVDDVIRSVVRVMEKRLDFDRGAILLADPEKTRLEIRGAYGYTSRHLGDLAQSFNLTKPDTQSPIVISFRSQKPFMVSDIRKIEHKLTPRSREFIHALGVESFLCCPIVVEGESLGILGVDNPSSKRDLVRSDVSLLQGIAPVIGVAIQNAALIEAQQSAFEKTLKILADSIDARDFLTAGHSEVVTEYAAGIAEELGFDEEYIQMIRIAALLHDYGKIGVPDSILKKDGRLTEEERAIINTHPGRTREILRQVPFQGIQTQVPEIAGAHHERWDGNGYPEGLAGEAIPPGARILAVADFFEAITSKRHYRDPMPLDAALKLLQEEAGTHFDPDVVDAFMRYLNSSRFCLLNAKKETADFSASRRAPRIEYRTQVSARCERRVVSGNIHDINPHGAYITTADPVEESTPLLLTFQPPGSNEFVQVQGQVVWTNSTKLPSSPNHPEGFGLRFTELPKNVQKLLEAFTERRQGEKGKPAENVIYPREFASK